MKYKTVLQRVGPAGGQWTFCDKQGACGTSVYDNFGLFYFPKPDEVGTGRRLQVRFDKPERPSFVEVSAWSKVRKAKNCGDCKRPLGKRRELKSILRPVKRDGETTGWSVFFRTNEPSRHYLRVAMGWKQKPGTHTSYGRVIYRLHVRTC